MSSTVGIEGRPGDFATRRTSPFKVDFDPPTAELDEAAARAADEKIDEVYAKLERDLGRKLDTIGERQLEGAGSAMRAPAITMNSRDTAVNAIIKTLPWLLLVLILGGVLLYLMPLLTTYLDPSQHSGADVERLDNRLTVFEDRLSDLTAQVENTREGHPIEQHDEMTRLVRALGHQFNGFRLSAIERLQALEANSHPGPRQ